MSLKGKMNSVASDFAKAVKNTSLKGRVDSQGAAIGTEKICGYVCRVHGYDDEDESLRGTVDVQEYGYGTSEQYYDDDDYIDGAGYHVGVLVSAINNNNSGFWVMPSLYSDVMIVQNPADMREYVVMCSHVDAVQLQSHKTVHVGVVETEEFKEGEDGPDVEELPETGNKAVTDYDKSKIEEQVITKNGKLTVTKTVDGIVIDANGKTSVKVNSDGSVEIQTKNVKIVDASSTDISSQSFTVNSSTSEFKGGQLIKKGSCAADGQGGFCGIPVCPFTGAPHVGTTIIG